MSSNNVIVRFENTTFGYDEEKLQLEEANGSVREGTKVTIMGQNGAGKTTMFKLMMGELKPLGGKVHVRDGATIAIAPQIVPKQYLDHTVREYFETAFSETKYNLDKLIADVFEKVNLNVPLDKKIRALSGGQQARLLLAYALIQDPDVLLLDEPTNNLDQAGIDHLTMFLILYDKTVIVISHDADFLNSFTDSVLYLDARKKKLEQYSGNYMDVVEQIKAQIEREERKNAQLEKDILDKKEKVNFFANKGGKMRKLAAKLKEEIDVQEENKVDVRKDDRAIKSFTIPYQHTTEVVVKLESVTILNHHEPVHVPVDIKLRRGHRLVIKGPNGIGKTTLLERLAKNTEPGAQILPGIRVGYYRQDFSGLNMDKTPYEALAEMMDVPDKEEIYATASAFLLHSSIMQNRIESLSEGQKGLLSFARFVLQKPALLILDEPSNHINFRHLPIIAEALNQFEGAMIIVSHMEEFMKGIRTTETLDLGNLLTRYQETHS